VEPGVYIGLILYFVILVLLAIFTAKIAGKSVEEFFIGGRGLQYFIVALSAVTSGRSAWLIIGFAGIAFAKGLSAVWALVGYIVVELFLFVTVGKRLREDTQRWGCVTLPEYFERRFIFGGALLRTVSAIIILIFMLTYVSAQVEGGAKAFTGILGVSRYWGLGLTAGIILLYTVLGGFRAVSYTDAVQGVMMLLVLVVVPAVAIFDIGGISEMIRVLGHTDRSLLDPLSIGLGGVIGFVGIGLGSPGNPHILVRYMSIRDPGQLSRSAFLGTCWNVVMGWGALFIGLVGRAIYLDAENLPGGDAERVFGELAGTYLSPFLLGLALAGVLAAIMSTADSQLLVATSAVIWDFYARCTGGKFTQRHIVWLSRILVVGMMGVAVGLAEFAEEAVFWLVLFAWGGLGASFGPALIISLFWRRSTSWGVLSGMIVGAGVIFIWGLTPVLKKVMYGLVPAFLIASIVILIVSIIGRSSRGQV
jgi:sodium/proline symporter